MEDVQGKLVPLRGIEHVELDGAAGVGPGEDSISVGILVPHLKFIGAREQLSWQRARYLWHRWPRAICEDLDCELDPFNSIVMAANSFRKVTLQITAQLNVFDHLHTFSDGLRATFDLELIEKQLFMLLRQRSFIEQSLCIVALILLHENIPRVQALEQLNNCIELTLHFNIGDTFEALLHLIIEVRSDIRRTEALLVQKVQKRPIASLFEQQLTLKAVLNHFRELKVKLEQFLCEQERIFQVLLAKDDFTTALLDVGLHEFDDLGKRVLVIAEHIVDQL